MGFSAAGICAGCSPEQPAAPANAGEKTGGSTEITFALDYTPNTNHTGIYVAQEKGYFDEAGLKVTIQQPPADGADALIGAGGAQMGVTYQDYIANSSRLLIRCRIPRGRYHSAQSFGHYEP